MRPHRCAIVSCCTPRNQSQSREECTPFFSFQRATFLSEVRASGVCRLRIYTRDHYGSCQKCAIPCAAYTVCIFRRKMTSYCFCSSLCAKPQARTRTRTSRSNIRSELPGQQAGSWSTQTLILCSICYLDVCDSFALAIDSADWALR